MTEVTWESMVRDAPSGTFIRNQAQFYPSKTENDIRLAIERRGFQIVEDKPVELQQKPAKERFVIAWPDEILRPQPPTDWIVKDLLVAGSVSLIVGEGGTKKTWSMIDLGVCVATGQPWLGFETSQKIVLFVDEESGKRRLYKRVGDVLRGHGASDKTPLGCISLASLNMRDEKDVAQLRCVILENSAQLVIIDALADIMPGGDENSVEDIQPIFHALRLIAEEAKCAIVIIHHANKNGSYRGSTAMQGAVDLMLMVTATEMGDIVSFKSAKTRDIEPISFSGLCAFGEETFSMSMARDCEPSRKLSKSEDYALFYVREHPGCGTTEVMENADVHCSAGSARNALGSLEKIGKIRRTGDTTGQGRESHWEIAYKVGLE